MTTYIHTFVCCSMLESIYMNAFFVLKKSIVLPFSLLHIWICQAENMIAHKEEIYSRPKRTWYATEREKMLLAKAARVSPS
jgi:hypothetical protein